MCMRVYAHALNRLSHYAYVCASVRGDVMCVGSISWVTESAMQLLPATDPPEPIYQHSVNLTCRH